MADFTRREIKRTFVQLLEERKYSDITIKNIVETCGISRSAFYYHFRDIPDLLDEIVKERTDEVIGQYTKIESVDECLAAMGNAIKSNKRALMHIYRSVDREYLEKQIIRLCNYTVSTYINTVLAEEEISEEDKKRIISYLEYLMVGFVVSWLQSGMNDDMAESFRETVKYLNNAAYDMAQRMKDE